MRGLLILFVMVVGCLSVESVGYKDMMNDRVNKEENKVLDSKTDSGLDLIDDDSYIKDLINQDASIQWSQVSCGDFYSCSEKACWGYNYYGALGDGSTVDSNVPMPTKKWKMISADSNYNCGIDSNTTLWCWGNNNFGQIGDGTIMQKLSPVSLGQGWTYVSAGGLTTCGLKGKDLWCWGNNAQGQYGNGTKVSSLIPVYIGGHGWINVNCGSSHCCGVDVNNKLWCWGNNTYGALGDGTNVNSLIPVEVK